MAARPDVQTNPDTIAQFMSGNLLASIRNPTLLLDPEDLRGLSSTTKVATIRNMGGLKDLRLESCVTIEQIREADMVVNCVITGNDTETIKALMHGKLAGTNAAHRDAFSHTTNIVDGLEIITSILPLTHLFYDNGAEKSIMYVGWYAQDSFDRVFDLVFNLMKGVMGPVLIIDCGVSDDGWRWSKTYANVFRVCADNKLVAVVLQDRN